MLIRPDPSDALLAALQEHGISALSDAESDAIRGFPVKLQTTSGSWILLDLESPLGTQAPTLDQFGIAIVDAFGFVRSRWGLAQSIPLLTGTDSLLFNELGLWVQQAICGLPAAGYHAGHRYFLAPLDPHSRRVWLVVADAATEKSAIQDANAYLLEAAALKRLGRALNLSLSMDSLCLAAVHELSSVGRLAAVMLWVAQPNSPELDLRASAGINRAGTQALNRLTVDGSMACLAEFVALSHKPVYINNCYDHLLASNIESKICYIEPGAAALWPLISGGSLMGVLELIGRQADPRFEEQMEIFDTFAEHLALALNSANLYESAQRRANFDSLTDIANHRTMQEFLQARMAEADRSESQLGMLLIDVDHFRSFNEEEGHQTGDDVLRMVAKTISNLLRPYDLAARYGGEEFAAVLPNANTERCLQAAERIRAGIEAQPFTTHSGRARHVTVSIGVASYPSDATDVESLIRAADQALYAAKRSGRNQVQAFLGSPESIEGNRTPLWHTLRHLIETEAIVGAESTLEQAEAWIQSSLVTFKLSTSQSELLRSALFILNRYEEALGQGDQTWLDSFTQCQTHRLLEPTLLGLPERYDGAGPRRQVGQQIPLLARVLQGIRAILASGGRLAVEDPGRFDPEVVAWMAQVDAAA